jgi:hypothetical protein
MKVCRGDATRWKTRDSVPLTVPPRRLRAWGTVRAGFERALADLADSAIAAAGIASEHRPGVDYVRVTVVLAVTAADVTDALAIAWDAFTGAARDNLTGWEIPAAAAEVQPEPPLPCVGAIVIESESLLAVGQCVRLDRGERKMIAGRHAVDYLKSYIFNHAKS